MGFWHFGLELETFRVGVSVCQGELLSRPRSPLVIVPGILELVNGD